MTKNTQCDLLYRKKRLHFQANHRSTKEADMIIGKFVEYHLNDIDENVIDDFEALVKHDDYPIMNWLIQGHTEPQLPSKIKALLKEFVEKKPKSL